jgi:cytochrome c-type biogenesis protein CcmH/NrfG
MFAKAAEADSRYAPAHLALGQLSILENDRGAALNEFEAALSSDPSSPAAVRAKAETLARQKGAKDAIAFVETALKTNSRDPRFHFLLGRLYLEDRQQEKAEAAYRKAAELDPAAAEPRFALAQLALSQGDESAALVHLQALLASRPGQVVRPAGSEVTMQKLLVVIRTRGPAWQDSLPLADS